MDMSFIYHDARYVVCVSKQILKFVDKKQLARACCSKFITLLPPRSVATLIYALL